MMSVLVIGGTRGTGRLIVGRLLDQGRRVRVLARNPDRARAELGPAAEVIAGDLTHPETLVPAVEGMDAIIFTAGCRSMHPASEATIRATEYEGTLHTLAAARQTGLAGRLMYMTASGAGRPSWLATCLNIYKGNTLTWRRRAEDAIRASGLDFTIIRAGILRNSPGGRHAIRVTQEELPLSLRYRIARADVAEAFVAALEHPRASRTTFESVWSGRGTPEPWDTMLGRLTPGP